MYAGTRCVTAAVAGAMTAGIVAANFVAVPEPTDSVVVSKADLAAITIPIINIDCCATGPLRVWRKLAVTAGTNPLLLGLIQEAGNTYDLPGLTTTVDSNTDWRVVAERGADFIDFGAMSEQGQLGEWELLGIAGGSANVDGDRNLHFTPLLGGSRGIGAGISGTLAHTTYTRNLSLFDSNLDLAGNRTVGAFDGELALMPFDGFKAAGGGTLFDVAPQAGFKLGSLTGGAGGHGAINGDGGLCLGSAQASCGGRISYLRIGAPVSGNVTLGNREILSADFEDNEVAVELRPGQFSVTGAVGGTFSIGSLDIGRQGGYPIDIQVPRNSMLSTLNNQRQTQTVRNSFIAVPGKSASDNETGGRHRATPLRDAVAGIKQAVNDAVSGKQAKPESED